MTGGGAGTASGSGIFCAVEAPPPSGGVGCRVEAGGGDGVSDVAGGGGAVGGGVIAHDLEAETGGGAGDGGVFNEVGEEADGGERAGGDAGDVVASDEDGDNGRRVAEKREVVSGEGVAEGVRGAEKGGAAAFAFGRADQAEGGERGGDLGWREGAAERGGRGEVAQEVGECGIAGGDEAAVGREGFGETADDEVDPAEEILGAEAAGAVRAQAAEVVSDVDEQGGVEFAAEGDEAGEVGRVGVHREQSLGDDEDGVGAIAGADCGEFQSGVVEIEVTMKVKMARRGGGALVQAVVGELIDDDVIGVTDERANRAVAGGPAGGAENGGGEAEVLGERGFEFGGKFDGAGEDGRAAAVRSETLKGVDDGVVDVRMRGEVEVILGGEVQAGGDGAIGEAQRGGRGGRTQEFFGKGETAETDALVQPGGEGGSAGGEGGTARGKEIAKAAGEGGRGEGRR
jgi:hypothetical protein